MRAAIWRPSNAIKKRGNQYAAFIDPSGLAGIMLFFLVLFMIPSTGEHGGRGSVDLAATTHATPEPGALKEDSLDIVLTRDGTIYFRHTRIKFPNLEHQIRISVQQGSDRKAYLRVDARAKYGDVKAVLDQIRDADIQDVALIVETARRK